MMDTMKRVKRSVALVVRGAVPGEFLIVRRPQDPADPLAGLWGLPAITLLDGEDEGRPLPSGAGRAKLGVELRGRRAHRRAQRADRGGHVLRLADYEAAIVAGVPAVPQRDQSMTQYTACRFSGDSASLREPAARGSLCAQVFLEARETGAGSRAAPSDNSNKRPQAADLLEHGFAPRQDRR